MIQRMGLKGCASRIRARPDDQFSALIRESLPDFREIDIETERQAQPAKISLKNSHLVARLDRWLQLELAPVRIDFVIDARDSPAAINEDRRIQAALAVPTVNGTDQVRAVPFRQRSHGGDNRTVQGLRGFPLDHTRSRAK